MVSLVQQPTVYLIDDDDAVRDSICMMLECEGFAVDAYASSEAFLREAHPQENSCAVVDVHMPGMSGLELLDRLRRDNMIIPAIVITGKVDERLVRDVERIGATLLEKPFRSGALVDCIKGALGRAEH